MRVEIRCSDCGGVWLVDGAGTDEVNCPGCLRTLRPSTGSSASEGADPANPPAEEIVCPRCQLHFYPGGRRRAVPTESRHLILVVEDQEYFRRIATDALESQRYEVVTASNTAEARTALDRGNVDLIVLDLALEGEQGRQWLSALQPKPCPVLIFTAKDEHELYGEAWEELKRLGADDIVVKGMQVAESLARKVGRLLGRPEDEG